MTFDPQPAAAPVLTPLAEARGAIQDVLAAIRNFEHLLQSPRVGPRSLAAVLPGIREACAPIERAIDELIHQIAAEIGAGEAATSLSVHARGACARLSAALASSASIADAKTRLALEADIIRTRAELDAIRDLADLLQSVSEGETEVELEDVVHQALAVSRVRFPGAQPPLPVAASVTTAASFRASPRLLMAALSFGLGLVCDAGVERPSVEVRCSAGRPLVIRVSDDSLDGDSFLVDPPAVIPPTLPCLQAAVRESGGAFAVERDGKDLTMTWPRS